MLWAVFRARRHRVLLCSGRICSGEGLEWGMWERGREEGGELFRAGLLLLSVSKMSLEAPTLETYFQNQNIWERLGPFQRLDKSGDTAKSRITQRKGMSKLVPSHLSSRFLVSQILLEWPFGLSRGSSTLTPPTRRLCPGRALAGGFANSSGHPKGDFTSWLRWSVLSLTCQLLVLNIQVHLGGTVILNSFFCHDFRIRRKLRRMVKTIYHTYASFMVKVDLSGT